MRIALSVFFLCAVLVGCSHLADNVGRMDRYAVPDIEAEWVRNGEPLMFEGEAWYPKDRFDVLLDSEVFYLGEYRGVPFFVEKIDIKPYRKLFTKFGRNKFRVYKRLDTGKNDQGC